MDFRAWELRENETLIEKADASYITKRMFVLPKPNPGKLYITNQRVLCTDPFTVHLHFEYPLNQIVSFSKGMGNLTLTTTDGKKHRLTGMFTKKLAHALEEAGVKNA